MSSQHEQREQLISELKTYVSLHFDGDYRLAFDHYDNDKDGTITVEELKYLFADVGIGNFLTRGTWAKAVVAELDKDGDNRIQWEEFQAVLANS